MRRAVRKDVRVGRRRIKMAKEEIEDDDKAKE